MVQMGKREMSEYFSKIGTKGGKQKSLAKTLAVRINGLKAKHPRKKTGTAAELKQRAKWRKWQAAWREAKRAKAS